MTDQLNRLTSALADRYAIERELGAGGMATVYLARDVRHERDVAVKVLNPDIAREVGAERFLREIRLAASLTHPHILPLYDSGESDGLLYYVMPSAEGASLRDRLQAETQLPVDESVRIAREIAGALDYAHRHDIVHRDIKPDNIMLHDGHALVADFGIGKAVNDAGSDTLTQTGMSVGTPAYMSPEQAAGESAIDGRSDLYALGCVLYEMLAGEPPFTGATAQAIIAKRFVQLPADITALRDSVPRPVGDAVSRVLARAPTDRFATGAELARALDGTDSGAVAVTGADPDSIAVLPFASVSTDPDNEFFSDGITEEIINALAQVKGLHIASRTSCFYFKGKSPEMREVGEKLKVSNVLEGSVRRSGERLRITVQLVDVARNQQIWSERYDRAMDDVFAVQDEIAGAIADRMRKSYGGEARSPLASRAPSDVRAYELYLKGRGYLYQRGMGVLKGLQCFQQALEIDPDYPLALAGLADANNLMAYYGAGPASAFRQPAIDAAMRVVEAAPDLAEGHNALACARMVFERDWKAAGAEFERALELNPRYVQARAWYGLFYLTLIGDRREEGIEQGRQCVEVDPLSGYANALHALCLSVGNCPDEANAFADKARELDPDAFLPHMTTQITRYGAGLLDEALAAAATGLAVSGRHPWSLAFYAVGLADAGRVEEARAAVAELNARATGGYVQPFMRAMATAATGDIDRAMVLSSQALREGDPALVLFGRNLPESRHLRADPRFTEILSELKLPDWTPATNS